MKQLFLLYFVATVHATPLVKAGHPVDFSWSLPDAAEPRGYDALLLRCIEQQTALDFDWRSYPNTRLFHLISTGELDLVYPALFDESRDQTSVRSAEFVMTTNLWLTLPDSKVDLSDKNITVSVKRDSLQQSFLQRAGYHHLVYVEEFNKQLTTLNARRVDAALIPERSLAATLPPGSPNYRRQIFNSAPGGFYLSQAFAKVYLTPINQAIQHCLQLVAKPE